MRSKILAAALVLAITGSLCAAELDSAEKAWAEACVGNLASPSERVRRGAEAALSSMGTDAIPPMLAGLGRLQTDDHWAALERALRGMGRKAAADALSERADSWPKSAAERLRALVDRLGQPSPPAPPGDTGVAVTVRALLATFEGASSYSSQEPRVLEIAAFGRRAVPVLLDELRADSRFARSNAAADAMALLATDEDVPALAALLADGHLRVATCFRRLRGEKVVLALLVPVEKGLLDHALLEALERHRSDRRVVDAVLDFLSRFGRDGTLVVGQAAEFLAESEEKAAIPLLVPLLDRELEVDAHMGVARALVTLGEKRGIPALIDTLDRKGGRSGGWARHQAGETLNAVVGQVLYSGGYESRAGRYSGNWKEAAKRFRAWWEASKDRLRFDASRNVWVVGARR